jgi:glycerol-3-phosphate dehydrogenase
MNKFHVIVIGAGSTGSALAHDLALRGLKVTIIERGGIASGTTGHNHGQLHSGGRYVVNDPEAARECILENEILRKIAPSILELNGGLFVATRPEHLAYQPQFLQACADCGIPAELLPVEKALRMNPCSTRPFYLR